MKRTLLGLAAFVLLLVAAGFGTVALQHVFAPSTQCMDLGGAWDAAREQCVGNAYPLP